MLGDGPTGTDTCRKEPAIGSGSMKIRVIVWVAEIGFAEHAIAPPATLHPTRRPAYPDTD